MNSRVKRSYRLHVAGASAVGCAIAILFLLGARTRPKETRLPPVMLWAWERPEDLRFLDPQKVGVAFLARTIELRPQAAGNNEAAGDGFVLRPRLQPLRVPEGTPLMAVVRIESSNDLWHRRAAQGSPTASTPAAPRYSDAQREGLATLAVEAAQLPGVKALQIDFDASQSEQPFYAALLQDVRHRLPREMPLSITALASWCIGDPWLEKLPPGTINEAVPMLFRMGPDAASVASYLRSANEFRPRVCRSSLGLSTDEPFSRALLNGAAQPDWAGWGSKRIYIFSPHAWTKQDAQSVNEEIEKWHNE
jgi:Protein of unknown function (DUF3142)